jgi:uncharacterized membrane protein HdeD (DUF308 family)
MLEALKANWRLIIFRGFVALLFGFLAFTLPRVTLMTLIILFSMFALFDGVFAFITGIREPKGAQGRGSMIAKGLISIAAGVFALSYPGITAFSFFYLIGAWAIISGGAEIAAAIALRHELKNEWLLLLAGALSVLFGVLMFRNPIVGAQTIIWLIGAFAVTYGIIELMFAFEMKQLGRDIRSTASHFTDNLTGNLGR